MTTASWVGCDGLMGLIAYLPSKMLEDLCAYQNERPILKKSYLGSSQGGNVTRQLFCILMISLQLDLPIADLLPEAKPLS